MAPSAADVAEGLDAALQALRLPFEGVSVGDPTDRSTWAIAFRDDATADQRTIGVLLLATFDPTTPATRELDPLGFAARFTDSELVAFEMLCAGTDATAAAARIAKMKLSLVKDAVHLDHPDTIKYLAFMKNVGILTDQRIAEILS